MCGRYTLFEDPFSPTYNAAPGQRGGCHPVSQAVNSPATDEPSLVDLLE
ncbi:hypothetical protein ACYJ1Y_00975 [Natrialbaceae archaeon A-gly3]